MTGGASSARHAIVDLASRPAGTPIACHAVVGPRSMTGGKVRADSLAAFFARSLYRGDRDRISVLEPQRRGIGLADQVAKGLAERVVLGGHLIALAHAVVQGGLQLLHLLFGLLELAAELVTGGRG